MTDTNQLPPLPNTRKLFEDDNNIVIGYTADQMRAYALQALAQVHPAQAEVTDERHQAVDQIMEQAQVFASAWALVGGRFDSGYALDDALEAKEELREMVARAILAPRPERVPTIARALAEWHEDDGYAVWWAWNGDLRGWAGEPAYIGSPLCDDWPGYHTHWTAHPTQPIGITAHAKKEGE